MINLNQIAREVILNRERRHFPSSTDLEKTTAGLAEEVGEWTKARRIGSRPKMIDALVDIMVYCLGGLEILGVSPEEELKHVIEQNRTREHQGHH